MKKTLFLVVVLVIGTISCKKEGCTDDTATNYDAEAKKDDGSCVLPDPRAPYLGNYWVTDSTWTMGSFDSEENYTLQVTTGETSQDTLYLNNLWNQGGNYFVILAGSNFSIPSQQVSGPYWTSGSGNFQNNIITYETSGDIFVQKGVGPK